MILLTVLGYGIVILLDQVQTFKNGNKRDFIVSCALCLLSFTVAILLASGLDLPSPVRPIAQWISQLIG